MPPWTEETGREVELRTRMHGSRSLLSRMGKLNLDIAATDAAAAAQVRPTVDRCRPAAASRWRADWEGMGGLSLQP